MKGRKWGTKVETGGKVAFTLCASKVESEMERQFERKKCRELELAILSIVGSRALPDTSESHTKQGIASSIFLLLFERPLRDKQ
jgi:hypothetical protein